MKVSEGDVLKRRGADGLFYRVESVKESGDDSQLVEVVRLGRVGYSFVMPLNEVEQKLEHTGSKSRTWEYTGRRIPEAHT